MTATASATTDRAKHIARITALLAKTEANGCTAEEAAAAKRMAGSLMTKYDITLDECQPRRRRDLSFDDIVRQYRQQRPEEDKRRSARATYHANGVHLDDDSYSEGCMCATCNTVRQARFGGPRATSEEHWAGFQPEAGPYADPSTSYGSRSTKGHRKNGSHADCTHDATSAARAKCRRQRQAA